MVCIKQTQQGSQVKMCLTLVLEIEAIGPQSLEATHLIFSHISHVGHVHNPYQSCWSHDRRISSVERSY